jgi:hypothetical protein
MPGIFSLIALLGLYWLLNLNYLDYLLMKVDFSFFDYDESPFCFICATWPLLFYLH